VQAVIVGEKSAGSADGAAAEATVIMQDAGLL
jgi:hypothetical protein